MRLYSSPNTANITVRASHSGDFGLFPIQIHLETSQTILSPITNPRCKALGEWGCQGPAGIHPVLSKRVFPPHKVRLMFLLDQVALQLFPQ